MKICWASNAPWAPTGYGTQTAQMVRRLTKAGHEVAVACNYGLGGGMLEWEGIRVYPTGFSGYSNDMIPAHALDWFQGEPGWLIALYDAWALKSPAYVDLNMAVWTPVDHHPVPPLVKRHFEDHGSMPIAMSDWGRRELKKVNLNPRYAPHGIETREFRPFSKKTARERLGLPLDKFIVGMVSTNKGKHPCRKAYPEAFAAFGVLHHEHPDSLLYVHAEKQGNCEGLDLELLGNARGIPAEAMLFTDPYRQMAGLDTEQMAILYSAFDVLLFPSLGEGFGLPAVEAQACGTPVIVTDFSAQRELVAPDAGWFAVGQPFWDAELAADYCIPLISELHKCLIHAYDNRAHLGDLTIPCREHALKYDADLVFDQYWVPILEQMQERISTEPIAVPAL